jgi:hypothetical protein
MWNFGNAHTVFMNLLYVCIKLYLPTSHVMLIDPVRYLCEMFVSGSTEHQHLSVAESEVQRAVYASTRFLQCAGLLFKNTSHSSSPYNHLQ